MSALQEPQRRHAAGPPFEIRDDDPRLPIRRQVVAERLRRYRESMSAEEFERLVADVARFDLRWLSP